MLLYHARIYIQSFTSPAFLLRLYLTSATHIFEKLMKVIITCSPYIMFKGNADRLHPPRLKLHYPAVRQWTIVGCSKQPPSLLLSGALASSITFYHLEDSIPLNSHSEVGLVLTPLTYFTLPYEFSFLLVQTEIKDLLLCHTMNYIQRLLTYLVYHPNEPQLY